MKKALPLLLLCTACFLFEDEDENQNTHLTLSEGAIGVTTVRLKVEPEDSLAEFTFELVRDDSTILNTSYPTQKDIIDTGLLANSDYTYVAHWIEKGNIISSSNKLNIQTQESTIQIEVSNIAKTNATLQMTIPDSSLNWSVKLYRNDTLVLTDSSNNNFISFTDWGLNPSTEYSYFAERFEGQKLISNSTRIIAETNPSDISLSLIDNCATTATIYLEREGSLPWLAVFLNNNILIDFDSFIANQLTYPLRGFEPGEINTVQCLEYSVEGEYILDRSPLLEIQTRDSTISNFYWTYDTLGEYGSYLNDVWIVNENDIWAVGWVRVIDTASSTGYSSYNMAHWNGIEWSYNNAGTFAPLNGIHYFNEDDLWVTSSFPRHWNGTEWILFQLQEMGIPHGNARHIWGSSSDDIYFAGDYGIITHYDGNTFTLLETGTESPFIDIGQYQNNEMVAVSFGDPTNVDESITLKSNNGELEWIYEGQPGIFGYFSSVLVTDNILYVLSDAGLKTKNIMTGISRFEHTWAIEVNEFRVRGTSCTDIFALNARGEFAYFNGSKWTRNIDLATENPSLILKEIDVRNNLVCLVGFIDAYSHAIVIRGNR